MGTLSYNTAKWQQQALRHMFWPDWYGFIGETVIALITLILFNASWLSNQLLSQHFGNVDPFPLGLQLLQHLLDFIARYNIVQQSVLFAFWAVVGALVYILLFRFIQLTLGVKRSVGTGVVYVKQEHSRGLMRWLGSMHDFFMKSLINLAGTAALLAGSVICFSIASQELNNGIRSSFPAILGPLALSLLAALLSVRLVVFGLSLLSLHFRNWYTA